MEKSVTINPSIAAVVNINSVGYNEKAPIYFTATDNWVGTYEFKIWNPDKNTSKDYTGTILTKADNVITLTIEPKENAIQAGTYYYEIISVETKRVVFKGTLTITK